MTNCIVCGIDAKHKCAGCSNVFYCSKEHQISDWKNGHKNNCKPYEVKRNEKLGRFMIASRNLKAGEVLFKEFPVAFGPKMSSSAICLGCHKHLNVNDNKNKIYRCSKCGWPVCSKGCENLPPHQEECRLMTTKKYKCPIKNLESGSKDIAYCMILPLRVLLLKKSEPKTFEKVMQLESHLEVRMKTKFYQTMKPYLVPFVQKLLGNELTEELIMTVAGILDTNCFEILLMSQQIEAGGLFMLSLILHHECIPNTKHYVNHKGGNSYEMTFETTVPVKKGDVLTTTYIQTLKPTPERRFLLKQNKCFDCDCDRCKDPTEFSTYASALICSKCTVGKIVCENSLNKKSDWSCIKCKAKYEYLEMAAKMELLQLQINNLNKRSPDECEEFLLRNYSMACSNYILLTEVKYILCLLYGNINGYQYTDLPDNLLERKIILCHEVLAIYDVLDPGRTNQRTNVVFELNCAKIIEIKRKLGSGLVTKHDAEIIISEALSLIKDSYDVLILENENRNIMDNRLKKIINESFVE